MLGFDRGVQTSAQANRKVSAGVSDLLRNIPSDIERRQSQPLPTIFQRYKSLIDSSLRKSLANTTLSAYSMLRYSMGWEDTDGSPMVATQGKALRPTLCLLACEATGGRIEKALPSAISLELIHHFSLIHDDIQDRDQTRHHRPTIWAVWGEPKALTVGNIMRGIANMSLWKLADEDLSPEEILNLTSLLTNAYLEMIEGQYLDISYEGSHNISIADYLEMISKKTGALIRCALCLGALASTRNEPIAQAFLEFGRSLGFIFQIQDDVLGIWGQPNTTGKPVGADILRKKNTLPVVFTMSETRGTDRKILQEIYNGPVIGDEEISSVLDIMDRVGAKQYANDLAIQHHERAMNSLDSIKLVSDFQKDFKDLTNFLLIRQH